MKSIFKILNIILLHIIISCNSHNYCIPPSFKNNKENSNSNILAKRAAPKEVTPIIIDNIKLTAPSSSMGVVEARDLKTDTLIWKKQVYTINYDKNLEEDIQWVFIDTMVYKCDTLYIHTEKNKVYKMSIKTLQLF